MCASKWEEEREQTFIKRGAKGGEEGVSGTMKVEVVYTYDREESTIMKEGNAGC